MGSSEGQTYCLRWNNHKSNLVEILDALNKMESYVDCTIYVDDHAQFKAHRVVLAANSPYFQSILQDVPMDHCSILFPGVAPFEMKALLEYMYTGAVNVTQSQIPRIMKIAEQLEVKGLFDMTELKDRFNKVDEPQQFPNNNNSSSKSNSYHNQSSPVISTSTNVTSAQSSSSSPPYSYKSPYSRLYSSSPVPSASERMPQWPTHLPSPIPTQHLQSAAAAMLSSVYDSGSDMNPLKRKKLSSISSMLMSRDTPILRNVLAQPNAADSSQPVPLVCQSNSNDRIDRHNGNGNDYSNKNIKYEEPHSPYTDKSFEDDSMDMSQNFSGEPRLASYVPQQKPEWKRYKQYTRNDILSAIECVRNGMSALQASRKYGVPSRTLYDKVKKLKITTGRPMNRTIKRSPSIGNNSPAMFPYGLGATSPYNHHNHDNPSQSQQHSDSERDREIIREQQNHHHMQQTIPHPAAALLDANFLQHALEGRGGDITGREALHAMAIAAAAHAAVNGISTSPGTHGTARSPSPGILMKYMRTSASPDTEKENNRPPIIEDEVEDLSMARKEREMMESPPMNQQQGVIVPPMTKVSNDSYNEIKREIIAEDDNRD